MTKGEHTSRGSKHPSTQTNKQTTGAMLLLLAPPPQEPAWSWSASNEEAPLPEEGVTSGEGTSRCPSVMDIQTGTRWIRNGLLQHPKKQVNCLIYHSFLFFSGSLYSPGLWECQVSSELIQPFLSHGLLSPLQAPRLKNAAASGHSSPPPSGLAAVSLMATLGGQSHQAHLTT